MSKITGNALVCQAGGPTAVINQSLVGVVLEARKFSQILKIYGARHGVEGVVNEDFLDLSAITTHHLEAVGKMPGAALGSVRAKPDADYCAKMFKIMERHNVRYFYLIGGNDGATICNIVNEEAKKAKYQLRVFHVPKTIDNDLVISDHTPGFGSAARFVASAFAGVNLDNLSLPGVYIGVVMGRHAGWLTAASILAKKYEDDGPHLIYLPEVSFSTEQFVKDVEEAYKKYGRCVVAVAEGVHDGDGQPIIAKLQYGKETDAHGNVQLSGTGALGDLLADLIKSKTKIKRVRADTLGYLQRSFLGCVSETDKEEAREVGERAVQYSIWHDIDGSVVIKRIGEYAVDYGLAPLSDVANKTKVMPPEFIMGNNNVSKEFINYAHPLVGDVAQVTRLEAPKVKKIK